MYHREVAAGRALVFTALIGAVVTPGALGAQVRPEATRPTLQVIHPMSVSPLVGAAPWNANGPAATRRVVTHASQGTVHLDMAYNTYKKGTKLSIPYAYKTDEFCFLPSGRIRMQDEAEAYEAGPGRLMWRPSGGVTRSVEFLEDTVTICSMAPARLDANSHRIPPQDVGKWSGDPTAKPSPHWFPIATAPVIPATDRSASSGVVEHEVLSERKDRSVKESVTYTSFERGAHLASDSKGEQICWVGSGMLRLTSGGETKVAASQTFFYRPEGLKIDRIQAITRATMTCFNGPAAL